jgi:hypothetical protein
VRCSVGIVAGQPRQVARVAAELRGDTVIGMPANGEGKDYDARSEVSNLLDDRSPCLIRILKVSVGQAGVSTLGDAEDPGRALCLLAPQGGTAPGASLALGEIQNPSSVAGVGGLEKDTGAGQFDVIAVGGDCPDVDGPLGNKA